MDIKELIKILDPHGIYITSGKVMNRADFGSRSFSNAGTTVTRLYLNRNGYILSLAEGGMAYSSDGTYEVAVFDRYGIRADITDDDVLKEQSIKNIRELMLKLFKQ
jgi:hypothetical protein